MKEKECYDTGFDDFVKVQKKVIKIKVTKEKQEEMNHVRIRCGLEEKPIVEEYELEALFG